MDHCLTSEAKTQIARNRQVLKGVIACLEVCGRQGISLRGHRDDSTSGSLNQGNFKALIQLRIDAGDVSLETHLQTCSKRATYMSKTTQNELLHCIGEIIQHKIVKDVQQQCDYTRSFYGIQADEVIDMSNWA